MHNKDRRGRWLPEDPVLSFTFGIAAVSIAVWVLVWAIGLHLRPNQLDPQQEFKTYFEAINWWPYPAFVLVSAPFVFLTWGAFLKAWLDLARTGVLIHADQSTPSEKVLADVITDLRRRRIWAVCAAFAATIAINTADLQTKGDIYFGNATRSEQLTYTCAERTAWNKWIVEELELFSEAACNEDRAESEEKRIEPPLGDTVFILLTWSQQMAIVFLICLAMGQIFLHILLFWCFERLVSAARKHDLVLRLNAGSAIGEFGLERWNFALNNFYWAASPAMLGVFMSRAATPVDEQDPGQYLLGILVPACLLAPMVFSILSRQARLPDVWPEVGKPDGFATDSYGRQLLWPLDRNWSSKLGIVLAFILGAFSLGYEMTSLLIFT